MATKTIPKNILHTDGLGREILAKLSKHVELPQTGFLAGGAVANTILSMEWGSDYPINDLDIFRIESTDGLESMIIPHKSVMVGLNLFYSDNIAISIRGYTVSNRRWKTTESSWRDLT